jgi:ABC-2 type transport system permease protein
MTAIADHHPVYRVTLGRVIRSEYTKLRTLRSTWITLGAGALLTVGLSGAFGYGYNGEIQAGQVQPTTAEGLEVAFLGLDLYALVIGVFGILQMSGEYGSGLIRASLAAVPRRLPLLWAKALLLVAVTGVLSLVVCLASFLVSQAFVGSHGAALSDPGVARVILGAAAYPVAMGLLGLGLGVVLRHTATAITGFVAALLIVPALLPAALSQKLEDTVMPYLPVIAAQATYALEPSGSFPFKLLSPGAGGAVLAAYVIAVLAGGAALLWRRDA